VQGGQVKGRELATADIGPEAKTIAKTGLPSGAQIRRWWRNELMRVVDSNRGGTN